MKNISGYCRTAGGVSLSDGPTMVVFSLGLFMVVLGSCQQHLGVVEESMHEGMVPLGHTLSHALHILANLVDGSLGLFKVLWALEGPGIRWD